MWAQARSDGECVILRHSYWRGIIRGGYVVLKHDKQRKQAHDKDDCGEPLLDACVRCSLLQVEDLVPKLTRMA